MLRPASPEACASAVDIQLGTSYKIINRDCIGAMQELPDQCADLIFADPPYWMRVTGTLQRVEGTEYDGCSDAWDNQFASLEDYAQFTRAWLGECRRILKKNGSIWVIGSMQCIHTIGNALQELGFWLINDVIWHKTNPTPNFKGTRLNNSHETLIWATRDQRSRCTFHYKSARELNLDNVSAQEFAGGVRKQLGSVWRIPVCTGQERLRDEQGRKLHSAQKPEALLYRVICISSNAGDMILDPFAGTMTTGAVALRTGRSFIGIEASTRYCRHGEMRLRQVRPELGEIERASYDIKPRPVKFTDMIDAGYLRAGETFYARNEPQAVLCADGRLDLRDGRHLNIHEAAALSLNARASRLNGFTVWQVLRQGVLVSIDEIRTQYRESLPDRE